MKACILLFAALLVCAALVGFANAQSNNPPSIAGLPDQTVMVGQTIPLLDLYPYVFDVEDPDSALYFSIEFQGNQNAISCYITGNRYLGCGAAQNQGYSDITVRVADTGGLYSTDTFRITVISFPPADHNPSINSIRITPYDPKDSDNLACTVDVSDQDGNLERVQFRWFVDGGLEKTRTIYVSGSYDSVQDTLESTRSGIGDEVRCEAAVYDSTGRYDSDYDAVTIGMQDCGVDVSSLEIIDNSRIRFRIRNTASSAEDIGYKVYVDGSVIGESSVALDSGELEIIQTSYGFGTGSFIVKVKATADCGSTDSETVIHSVIEPSPPEETRPSINYIRITPASPDEWEDLECRVEMTDPDGNLDRLQIRWYVEGNLERTRTFYVSGGSDTVEDTLDSSYSREGDEVRCAAMVSDRNGNEDSDSDYVIVGENGYGCGVDVYSLELIDNNEIRFRIRNSGNDRETVNYKVYVEEELIIEHNLVLEEDEYETIHESFSFDVSDSLIKVKARSECGSTDSEFLFGGYHGICQQKYLDEYRCSGNWVQRKYQYSDCSTIWVNSEYCSQGCSGGSCTGTGQCGVSIQKFDYQTNIVAGNAAYVTVEARNTANRQETITLSLWVDGVLKESYPSSISPGSVSIRTFYYYPSAGTHQILVKAETNCGTSDTRTATVTVMQSGQPAPYPYPYPTPQPVPSLPTAVSIYPSSLDTSLCQARFITIDIHNSVEQVYTIQVTGVPADWVSYQSQNIVKTGDRQLFVYAGPKELGSYTIRIRVTAESEKKSFEQDVSIYTATCTEKPAEGDGITGSLIEAAKSPFFWVVLIIIMGSIVIFVGYMRLKPDEEFYEPGYPHTIYRPVRKSE